jgi:hypothetical protein
MGRSKHHHFVPRGLQRHFALGERIRRVAKDGSSSRVVGIADTFVKKNLYTYYVNGVAYVDAEDAWSKLEAALLPHVRRAMRRSYDRDGHEAVRVLMAMQVVRSSLYQRLHDKEEADAMARLRVRVGDDPEAVEAFVADHGRLPADGELEALTDRLIEERRQSRTLRTELTAWVFEQFAERTKEFHVEISHTLGGSTNFMLGDTPVMISRKSPDGFRELGVALGDADLVAMPLGRKVYAALSREPRVGFIDTASVRQLNQLMWLNSQEAVALHPQDNLRQCLGVASTWTPPEPLPTNFAVTPRL